MDKTKQQQQKKHSTQTPKTTHSIQLPMEASLKQTTLWDPK